MADIRKRVGKKGTTYQVRYPNTSTKSGYAFKTFDTLKQARAFVESGALQTRHGHIDTSIATVPEAIDRWLDICLKEGRDGRDPVTDYTHKTYVRRSEIMKAFDWPKPLAELQTPDVVAFRSWLLRSHSRDLARKTLTSFHAVIKEMALRGHVASNFASGVAIRADSRYDAPVVIPTIREVAALLNGLRSLLSEMILGPARIIRDYLGEMTYIGPLREIPTRSYRPQVTPDEARWAHGLAAWDQLYNDRGGELMEDVNRWLSGDSLLHTGYSSPCSPTNGSPSISKKISPLLGSATPQE